MRIEWFVSWHIGDRLEDWVMTQGLTPDIWRLSHDIWGTEMRTESWHTGDIHDDLVLPEPYPPTSSSNCLREVFPASRSLLISSISRFFSVNNFSCSVVTWLRSFSWNKHTGNVYYRTVSACLSCLPQLPASAACLSCLPQLPASAACLSCLPQLPASAACLSCLPKLPASAACLSCLPQLPA